MAINKELVRPAVLYFETSILRQLPPELDTVEFMRLRELCSMPKTPMFIPRLVLDEWIFEHKQRVLSEILRIEKSLQDIRNYNYVISKPSISWPTKKESILQEVEDYLKKSVTEVGMQIIERPEISLDMLLDMSVKKTRPFEERGEKGFRDTVILFTVLGHAKNLPNVNHLLLATDKGYNHEDVYAIANIHNVKLLIVGSLSDAISNLEQLIDAKVKDYRAERVSRLETFLNGYKDKIIEYIRTHGRFSAFFLSLEAKGIPPFTSPSIKRINSIELIKIHDAMPGYLPKGVKRGRVKISFKTKVTFSLTAEMRSFDFGPKLRIGETQDKIEIGAVLSQFLEQQDQEITIERDISVEASVLFENENYSDFQIERLLTW